MQIVTTGFAVVVSLYMAMNICLMCTALLVIAIWKKWFAVNRKAALLFFTGVIVLFLTAVFVLGVYRTGWENGFKTQRLLGWLWPEKYAEGAGYIYMWIRSMLGEAKFIDHQKAIHMWKEPYWGARYRIRQNLLSYFRSYVSMGFWQGCL